MGLEAGRVFFLGAGFSAGAGVPLTNTLLPKAAKLFQQEAPGLFERISWFASDADVDLNGAPNADDFARLCTHLDFMELREHGGGERWSAQGSRERLALKYFLAKVIARSTPAPADLPSFYHEFARGLTPWDVIVTFNWDGLVEAALAHVGIPYSYSGEEGKVPIVKLHGSIHWLQGEPRPMRRDAPHLGYVPIGFDLNMPKDDVHMSERLLSFDAWAQSRCLTDEVKPLIVLPGYGKAVDVRLLSAIWYRPEFLSVRHGGVSVIGLSVAQDDYIVESLFRYLFRSTFDTERQIRVVNPDRTVGTKLAALGPELTIDFIERRLSDETVALALMTDWA